MAYQVIKAPEEALWWSGLDLLAKGLIVPLGNALSHPKGEGNLKIVGYNLLQGYLTERERWLARWNKTGITNAVLLTHPLIQPLETTPSPNGWSPYSDLLMSEHIQQLVSLTSPTLSACRVEGRNLRDRNQ